MIDEIRADDLVKQYGEYFTLNCSLDLKRGKRYAIIGPNGSGKSTLLRILSLLDPPDSGTIIYSNNGRAFKNSFNNIHLRRKTVLLPTRATLFNDAVFYNVSYGLKIRGMNKNKIKQRVLETLNEVGLAEKEEHPAHDLSSGEAQRLALARALVLDPDVLFLDEPTASLDPSNTRLVENLILRWSENRKKIFVMVTHSLFQARRISDSIVLMYGGRVIEVTDNDSFFKMPSTELGKRFLKGEFY